MKLGRQEFPAAGNPLPRSLDEDKIARVYAMVTNIDANVGRLLEAVESKGIADSTIVVFLTDNGPAFPRYNAGLRGLKGTVYEGGIRVPCYVRWPGHFPPGRVVDRIAAHIDITPTLLDACGVAAGAEPKLDGRSLLPLLRGEPAASGPSGRFTSSGTGATPPSWAGPSPPAPTIQAAPRRRAAPSGPQPPLELYDIEQDPFEQHDLAAARPELVNRMYRGLPRLVPRRLRDARVRADPHQGRRSAREPDAPDAPGLARSGTPALPAGHWELEVARPGRYDVTIHVSEDDGSHGGCAWRIQGQILEQTLPARARSSHLSRRIPHAGPARLEPGSEKRRHPHSGAGRDGGVGRRRLRFALHLRGRDRYWRERGPGGTGASNVPASEAFIASTSVNDEGPGPARATVAGLGGPGSPTAVSDCS